MGTQVKNPETNQIEVPPVSVKKPMQELDEEVTMTRTPFILIYKARQATGTKPFWMPSNDLKEAIDRGRKHCDVQRYKFIRVDPMFYDLDSEDKRRLEEYGG